MFCGLPKVADGSQKRYNAPLMPVLSIIIPAYNEEAAVAPVIQALRQLSLDAEIIVVDDGSTDRTAEVAEHQGARVVRHAMNMGYGASLKDGIRIAASDIIVITDADGTYPADAIPSLFATFRRGFDMVVGARQGAAYRGALLKMPARVVFTWIVEFVTGRTIPDINSGLRIFRKGDVLPYLNDLCNGFSFTTTITLVYQLTGKMVTYVPISYHTRIGQSKVRMVRDTLRTLQYITEAVVRFNPIKAFLLFALVPFFIGVASEPWAGIFGLLFGALAACVVFAMGLVVYGLKR